MSRTQSQGINYFPFAVDFFSDNKVKILKARYGNDGVAIYIYLLCCIYREGYYTRVDEDLYFIISDELGISLETVQQVMTFLLKRSMFNEQLFKSDTILTSDGIQERWQDAIRTRAAKRPIEVGKYWLLRQDKTIPHIKCTFLAPNSENNGLNSENNGLNSENYHNKVKESKVKEETPNPLQGGGIIDWKERFFETFTFFERKNYKDDGVDYKVLFEEFEKSSYLKTLWSFPRVVKLYPQIANGDFRDKLTEQQKRTKAIDDMAERERYYSLAKSRAQAVADKNKQKATQNPRFNEIEKALSKLELEIAKAELYQPEKLESKLKERIELLTELGNCLSSMGLRARDLHPTPLCEKCSDTGWLSNGRACDCYKKEEL